MTEMFLKFLTLVGLACLGFYAAYLAFTVYAGTDIPTVLIFMIFLIPLGVTLNWVFKLPSVASVVNVAAGLTCLLFLGGQVAFDFRFGRDLVAATEDALDPVRAWDKAISNQPIDDSDLLPLLPILDELRGLPAGYNSDFTERPSLAVVGPEQLHRASVQAYVDTLNRQMLPRLLLRLENRMWENINSPEVLYDLLKAYLMLGQQGPLDAQFVQSVFDVDWGQTYRVIEFDTLNAHLAAMLEYPMERIDLDGALVGRAQWQIAQEPIAVMAYRTILSSAAALDLPEFRLTEVGGPAVARVFQRASGARLDEGISGIYTYQGFHSEFLPALVQADDLIFETVWVLGPYLNQVELNVPAILQDVLALYESDFNAQYQELLGDLDIVPINNIQQATDVTGILSGPNSPMFNILNAIAQETRLDDERADDERQQRVERLSGRVLDQQWLQLEETGQRPGSWVAQSFAGLHSLFERTDGLPSELDRLFDSLTEVYLALNAASVLANADQIDPVLKVFRAKANELGEPISRWAHQIDVGTSAAGGQSARARANAIWQAEVLPFCEAASYSYPFDWKAEVGIPIDDFTQLFGPGGLIDVFFQENLARYVDTTGPQWRLIEDSGLSVSETVLRQMQNAAQIRGAFFPKGTLAFDFTMSLEALDPSTDQIEVSLDDRWVQVYRIDTPETVAFRWDGKAMGAGFAFAPDILKQTQYQGAWAPFRLFASGQLRRTDDGQALATLSQGQRLAIMRIEVENGLNPFVLPAVSEFSCPRSL